MLVKYHYLAPADFRELDQAFLDLDLLVFFLPSQKSVEWLQTEFSVETWSGFYAWKLTSPWCKPSVQFSLGYDNLRTWLYKLMAVAFQLLAERLSLLRWESTDLFLMLQWSNGVRNGCFEPWKSLESSLDCAWRFLVSRAPWVLGV